MIKFFNTLSRRKENFKPIKRGRVGLYTCGPTVYNFAHIGNLRTYIFEDILRRTLEYGGYRVKHVMNITDVGHLTSDADEGEDKLEKEAKKEQKSPWKIAKFYTTAFLNDLKRLNIKKANILSPATKNIKEQIKIIKNLFKKRYAYDTPEAVYFDISKFSSGEGSAVGGRNYAKISRQDLEQIQIGAREEVETKTSKRHPSDFALWFKCVGRFKNHIMRWTSPWGIGFPGWHIECSAISTKYLGQPFDIHTGGVDHIYPHHTNEIAQSEGAFEKPLAKFWIHGEFLVINGLRMGKSKGNFLTLDSVVKRGFNPLTYRYFVLGAHYRSKLNFTWEALRGAQNALEKLYEFIKNIKKQKTKVKTRSKVLRFSLDSFHSKFNTAIHNDLNTPKSIAVLWNIVHNYNKNPLKFDAREVLDLLYEFDKVLGLGFSVQDKKIKYPSISSVILQLAKKREELRRQKKWALADKIREELKKKGYLIEDTPNGSTLKII